MVNLPPINRMPTAYSRLKRQGNIDHLTVEKPATQKHRDDKDRRQRIIKVYLDRRHRRNRRNNPLAGNRNSATTSKKGTNINTTA